MRVAFMGTPAFAVPALNAARRAGHEIVSFYTQPPRPAGRGKKLQSSPVQQAAEPMGIPVRTPADLRDPGEQSTFRDLRLDAAVVVAYGLILPPEILEAPRHGCLNIHASLLPRWRGAAPIQRAIEAGDTETGISIMRMDEGLDTGPVLLEEPVRIYHRTTAKDLHDALATLGARLIEEALDGLETGALHPKPQPAEGITYAHKLTKAEGELDWRRDAGLLDRRIRAFTPVPGCWFMRGEERIKVLEAVPTFPERMGAPGTILAPDGSVACGTGALRVIKAQRPGKGPVTGDELLRGLNLEVGEPITG
jgi:methionyl-tRNA formyltransferase